MANLRGKKEPRIPNLSSPPMNEVPTPGRRAKNRKNPQLVSEKTLASKFYFPSRLFFLYFPEFNSRLGGI